MKNSTTKPLPIGPQTQQRAAETEAGKLAKLLNRILYYSDTRQLQVLGSPGALTPNHYLISNALTFVNKDPLPEGLHAVNSHVETEEALRAIRDFLEYKALEEVIP